MIDDMMRWTEMDDPSSNPHLYIIQGEHATHLHVHTCGGGSDDSVETKGIRSVFLAFTQERPEQW